MPCSSTPSELRIPKPRGEIVGAILAALFVGFFAALSVINISRWEGLIGSSLYLLLMAVLIHGLCREAGVARFLIDLVGAFAPRHLMWFVLDAGCSGEVCFGYSAFGRLFCFLALPVDRIESVEWTTGQATSIAGRDMNDWHVIVWYDHRDPARSERQRLYPKPDQELYIVGPSRRKDLTTNFGLSVVALLRQAGASLEQSDDECLFVRQKTSPVPDSCVPSPAADNRQTGGPVYPD